MLPASFVVLAFLVLPVGYVLLLSLNPSLKGDIELSSDLTLQNYGRLFLDSYYVDVLFRSVWIATITTLISAVMGYLVAVSLWRAPKSLRSVLMIIVLAPLLISVVVRTYGWMVILGDRGVLNGALTALGVIERPLQIMFTRLALVIGLVHVFMPFMALSILSSLERIDPAIPEAARTLGAGSFAVHRDVIIPLVIPGFAAGVTMVFSLSISAYVIPILMGSSGADVVTTLIYQQFMVVFNWHFGAALTAFLLAASLSILAAVLYVSGRLTRPWLGAPR
ncbi:MAG TPA: ABC transporter permease [Solirubrobacterales bacterium]|nr:ABC transporter permease [Solirubrobacterales bacterium]